MGGWKGLQGEKNNTNVQKKKKQQTCVTTIHSQLVTLLRYEHKARFDNIRACYVRCSSTLSIYIYSNMNYLLYIQLYCIGTIGMSITPRPRTHATDKRAFVSKFLTKINSWKNSNLKQKNANKLRRLLIKPVNLSNNIPHIPCIGSKIKQSSQFDCSQSFD